MQLWDYLFVITDLAGGDRLLVRWINGQELPNWKQSPPAFEFVKSLGLQGWELVTVDSFGMRHTTLIFKRPITSE